MAREEGKGRGAAVIVEKLQWEMEGKRVLEPECDGADVIRAEIFKRLPLIEESPSGGARGALKRTGAANGGGTFLVGEALSDCPAR